MQNVAKSFRLIRVSDFALSCSHLRLGLCHFQHKRGSSLQLWLTCTAYKSRYTGRLLKTACHCKAQPSVVDLNREDNIWSLMIRWQAVCLPFLPLGFWLFSVHPVGPWLSEPGLSAHSCHRGCHLLFASHFDPQGTLIWTTRDFYLAKGRLTTLHSLMELWHCPIIATLWW